MDRLAKLENNIAVIDVDDVLFFTTSLWFDRVMHCEELLEYAKPEFKKLKETYEYTKDFFYNYKRDKYLFSDWILREDLTEDERTKATDMILNLMKENNFYQDDKLKATPLVSALRSMAAFPSINITKYMFVTRTLDGTKDDKIELLKFYFAPILNKIEICLVPRFENKANLLGDCESHIRLIIDDEFSNIFDYLKGCKNLSDCIILLPETGYNSKLSAEEWNEIGELTKDRNIEINHYSYENFGYMNE